ncbi:hypothetical protein DBP19_36320 [Streptomyces sp. CS090A]|uniref:hypothetical protein n=1 Tax=Streptomyces sp. CS090A TaxID=2162710 RepID=UPI000D516E9A|nr:hypothetical protein [Streptomyces sp. CS090A]PVC80606.1 hypothetical protein DBP19_36320 [Streptomyces sp. CS090A]
MAHWNLDVSLRGQGNNLSRKLKSAAADARDLAAAARDAQGDITQLGTVSTTAGKAVKKLGTASEAAATRLLAMGAQAKSAAKDMRKLERDLASTDAQIRAMASEIRISAELDDQTATGIATIRAALTDLQSLGPIRIAAELDDQTTTGIAGVTSSIASLEALSPITLRAILDDDTGPGAASVATAIANLQALSPVDITANFTGDTAQMVAAATAMGDLRDRAEGADNALNDLTTRSTTTAAALNAVQQEAQDVSRALRTLRGRAAAAAEALDELGDRARHAARGLTSLNLRAATANTRMGELSTSSRTLRSDMDDLDGSLRRATGGLGGVRGSLGSTSNAAGNAIGNTKNLIMAAVALGTALIPIAAATAPIAAGLAASGAAIGVFGVAVAGQIVALTEAAEAETKYQDAIDEHGKASEEAVKAETEYLRVLADMPPASREAAAALAVLKDEYTDWSDALSDDTMPVVTKSMGLFGAMLPKLTPLVRGTSKELDRLLNVAAGGMTTPGFDRFIKSFTDFATGALARGTTHLVNFSRALDTGEIGSDLREFMAYARENGPLVGETLMNLAKVITNLLVAFSDMGVSVLTAVNALAQLINAIPPEALSAFVQLYAGMKLITLGMAAMGAVAGGAALANVTAFGRSMMFGGVRPAIGGVIQRMSGLQKAAIGLGVLGVAAIGVAKLAENARGAPPDVDRLTTSLKRLAETGKFTGELKKTFGDVDGLVKKIGEIGDAAKANEDYVKSFANSGIGPLDDLRSGANELWQDLTKGEQSLTALEDDFKGLDQAMAGMVQSGYGKQAAADFSTIEAAAKKAGHSTKEIAALFPEYQAAVAAAAAEQELAVAGMGLFGQQALDVKTKLDAQKASADGLRGAVQALNDANRAALGGMIGFEAAIDAADKAAKKNAGSLKMVNGELDLNSPKAQAAATALQDLGGKTDEAAAAAREQGRSWEYVNGIYQRGEQAIIKAGQAMGLTKPQAEALAASILKIPDSKKITAEMRTDDATADLNAFNAKVKASPGSKSVTLKTLSKAGEEALEAFGYKVKRLPNGKVTVTAATGGAISGIGNVAARLRDLDGRTATVTTRHVVINTGEAKRPGKAGSYADGGIVATAYANGGIRGRAVQHFAAGSENHIAQIAPAGAMRVWAEPETMGEGYVPFAPSKRPRSRAITEEIVRRLGGDPDAIQWNANGSVTNFAAGGGFSYNPGGLRRDTGYVQSSYSSSHQPIDRDAYLKKIRAQKNAVDSLKTAEAKLTQVRKNKGSRAQIVAAEAQVAKARRSVATATEAARKAEARYKKTFSLSDWQKTLKTAVSANASYEKNLAKIGARGGSEIVDQLRDLGEEGAAIVSALAKASNKQFKDIVNNLKKLGPLAKASLADYTKQLAGTNRNSTVFQGNLSKLAAMGYGDLATQLASQGDEAAEKLAAEAVKSKSKASSANTAAKNAGKLLSGEELEQLIAIIAAVKTSKTGLHAVADSTGLGEDEIIAIANKAQGQIKGSLGSRASKFLLDVGRANRGLSYANGGIREGIYATRGGAVTFAEPSTGGEAYIPLGANKRGPATNVLRDVASRFGVGLTDVSASRPVVIVREGGDTNVTVHTVRTGASGADIGAQVGRSVRRARRGGVNARATA